jgi:hypothetical protein
MHSTKLNIIHYNDVYELRGTGQPGVCGGADRFCALVNKLRKEYDPLVLFSGDLWNPSKRILCLSSIDSQKGRADGPHREPHRHSRLLCRKPRPGLRRRTGAEADADEQVSLAPVQRAPG